MLINFCSTLTFSSDAVTHGCLWCSHASRTAGNNSQGRKRKSSRGNKVFVFNPCKVRVAFSRISRDNTKIRVGEHFSGLPLVFLSQAHSSMLHKETLIGRKITFLLRGNQTLALSQVSIPVWSLSPPAQRSLNQSCGSPRFQEIHPQPIKAPHENSHSYA